MFWMHIRADKYGDKDQILPIGKWKDVKVENINGIPSITAEPVFDENDKFAMKIKSKVDGDFIKMASAGLQPLSWSELPDDMKPGQTRPTITEWELVEASIVDIGANKNAFRLMNPDGTLNLSFGQNSHVIKTNITENMKKVFIVLGLPENSTESDIVGAIEKLQSANTELAQLKTERVAKLMQHPKITAENKANFEKLAKVDYELAEKTLETLSKVENEPAKTERISDFIEKTNHASAAAGSKKWDEHTAAELETLREKNLKGYIEIFEKEFGYAPKID
jgi:hypothetical protein